MKSPNTTEKWVNTPFKLKDFRKIAIEAAKAGMPVCRFVAQKTLESLNRK